MARLTEEEKTEIRAAAERPRVVQPQVTKMSPAAYAAFATFASRLSRAEKPVRFGGKHWKL